MIELISIFVFIMLLLLNEFKWVDLVNYPWLRPVSDFMVVIWSQHGFTQKPGHSFHTQKTKQVEEAAETESLEQLHKKIAVQVKVLLLHHCLGLLEFDVFNYLQWLQEHFICVTVHMYTRSVVSVYKYDLFNLDYKVKHTLCH